MMFSDLKQPLAKLTSGELEEAYPEAHAAFVDDFLCAIQFVGFYVDEDVQLWALIHEVDLYRWQPGWIATDGTSQPGTWMDAEGL